MKNKVISLLLAAVLCLTVACNVQSAVDKVSAQIPSITSAALLISSFSDSDPQAQAIITEVSSVLSLTLPKFTAAVAAYNVALKADKPAKFQAIVVAVDEAISGVDPALLAAVKISNPASQQRVEQRLAAISTLLHVVDGILYAASSSSAHLHSVPLREVAPLLDRDVVLRLGFDFNTGIGAMESAGF